LPERYHQSIINYLSSNADAAGLRADDLAQRMNIPDGDRPVFDQAVDQLAAAGRVLLGTGRMLMLPALGNSVTGIFRQTTRGFGFVIPDEPNAHGDLFIPAGENRDAVTGDFVTAKVVVRDKYDTRDQRRSISGRIVEILKRATNRAVGTLTRQHNRWLVMPDGNVFRTPIEIQDITAKSAKENDKVVVEILRYPNGDQLAQGVITEVLGSRGEPEVELISVLRQFDLPKEFPAAVMDQARKAATDFDPENETEREDLSKELIVTIDPDDARDFDDAISLRKLKGPRSHDEEVEIADGAIEQMMLGAPGEAVWELGVHIADVAHFVTVESPMDLEARTRGNSTYFPKFVIPMLPEVLSNGVCSLQEAQPRLTKTAFIRYDAKGNVVGTRMANTIIKSRKRFTYKQAQAVIDDAKGEGQPWSKGLLEVGSNPNVPQVDADVRELLVRMDRLARIIRQRRLAAGMIVLDLPEVELVMDDEGRVIDAMPEDDSYTHKIIEMFMVEANEAVARFLTKAGLPVLRRIHPEPDITSGETVRQFLLIAGKRVPKVLDRKAIQGLLDSVRGTPLAHAIHLAVLKTFTTAEYSPLELGHYALASDNYAHFTSPIRRYADLVIHRELDSVLRKRGHRHAPRSTRKADEPAVRSGKPGERKGAGMMPEHLTDTPDYPTLMSLGKHLNYTERRSSDAERELRAVKVLQLLAEHVGDVIDGVVTGVTGFGVFVQSTRFLTEGLIRVADLPDDAWQFDDRSGVLKGIRTGRRIALGDRAKVQIVSVNIPARQLEFRLLEHGSSITGETGLKRLEPRKLAKGQPANLTERDRAADRDIAGPRKKNTEKRLSRKEEARRRAQQHQEPAAGHAPKKQGRGRGRRRGRR